MVYLLAMLALACYNHTHFILCRGRMGPSTTAEERFARHFFVVGTHEYYRSGPSRSSLRNALWRS